MKHLSTLSFVLLMASVSGLVQCWLVAHAVVPAADSVGFVGLAQSYARDGLVATLAADPSPPVFPLLVAAAHWALTHAGSIADSNWGTAAQIAAAVPLVLAIAVGWRLFRRSVSGIAAALAVGLACVLTVLARLGADGLSDSTHLALVTLGLAAIAAAIDPTVGSEPRFRRPAILLIFAGMALALAQLTRVEAAVVIPAFMLFVAIEAVLLKRMTPRRAVATVANVALGFALVALPYLALLQPRSAADALATIWTRRGPSERTPLNSHPSASIADGAAHRERPQWRLADGSPMAFGRKDPAHSLRFRNPAMACFEFAREVAQSLNYVLGPLALVGLWSFRRRLGRPIDRFLTLLIVLHVGCVLGVATTQGYLAGRHLLLVAWLALPWAGEGICAIGRAAGNWLSLRLHVRRAALVDRIITAGVAATVLAGCLATTLVPLHASHRGHQRAIDWLATEADDGAVLDTAGYTALYSGRKTYRYAAATDALADPDLAYLVVEESELQAPTPRGETMRELLGRFAEPEAIFAPAEGKRGPRTVMLFRWRPWEFAHHLRGDHAR